MSDEEINKDENLAEGEECCCGDCECCGHKEEEPTGNIEEQGVEENTPDAE